MGNSRFGLRIFNKKVKSKYPLNIINVAKRELHDIKFIAANIKNNLDNYRIIKGGSWLDGSAYIYVGSYESVHENKN